MNKKLENRTIQIRRTGVDETLWEDLYHRLMRLSWPRFFALLLLVFFGVSFVFAVLYSLFPGSVANIPDGDLVKSLAFSVQTMSTVGYGYFYPQTNIAHVLVAAQSALGIFFTAVLTGLLFAKFSRPSARVVFSDNILWTTQNGQEVLVLRLGNVRANRVFEGKARMTLLKNEITTEGEKLRRLIDLKLMRSETPLFALSWTLYHPIDNDSPFKGMSPEQAVSSGWDIYTTFIGLDQDMAQTIVTNTTYTPDKIIRARKFADMIHEGPTGLRTIDYSKLHDIEH